MFTITTVHNKVWFNTVFTVTIFTDHTMSRNKETTNRGNHKTIGCQRLPLLLTTSDLPKIKATN